MHLLRWLTYIGVFLVVLVAALALYVARMWDRVYALPLMGPLGAVYAKNLTPDPETGIGRYSDAQIARMMQWAVRPDGRGTVEPMMPFGNTSQDDMIAILSYLRAQKPVRHAVPEDEWTTLGKVVKSVSPVFKPRTSINPPAVTRPGRAARS